MTDRISIVDLSKELGVRAADLMLLANDAGVPVARMAATITGSQADTVRAFAEKMTVRSVGDRRIISPKTSGDSALGTESISHVPHETDAYYEDGPA